MNLRQIPNNIIAKVDNMIRNGYTYNQIKEATGVSHGTIAKVKKGKIPLDRKMVKYITPEEHEELKQLLANKEEEIIQLTQHIQQLESNNPKYLKWLEQQKDLEKALNELDVSQYINK